jgi:hypothetical protein
MAPFTCRSSTLLLAIVSSTFSFAVEPDCPPNSMSCGQDMSIFTNSRFLPVTYTLSTTTGDIACPCTSGVCLTDCVTSVVGGRYLSTCREGGNCTCDVETDVTCRPGIPWIALLWFFVMILPRLALRKLVQNDRLWTLLHLRRC